MRHEPPAPGGRPRRLVRGALAWLDDRVGLQRAHAALRKKEVPVHRHTFWYYLGGMALFLFMLQVSTGILLLFYYRPSAEGAYESVSSSWPRSSSAG